MAADGARGDGFRTFAKQAKRRYIDEVSVLGITANEPPVDNTRDRQIRFDITGQAENGERLNIEMSLNPDPFEPIRLEFYAGKLFTGQDISGVEKEFNDLKASFQIAILAKKRFFKDEDFFHCFEYYDPARNISLDGRSRIITVELSKLGGIIEKPTVEMTAQEQWAVFFRYLPDKSKREKINELVKSEEGIAMASAVLQTISRDEVERARLLSEYKYVVDTQSKVVHAKREGEQKSQKRIARNMKAMGLSTEQIIQATGLTGEQLKGL